MEALSKFARTGYASCCLLLGWFGAIVGALLLVCGIVGAVVGRVIWSIACDIIAGARASPERAPAQTGAVGAQATSPE